MVGHVESPHPSSLRAGNPVEAQVVAGGEDGEWHRAHARRETSLCGTEHFVTPSSADTNFGFRCALAIAIAITGTVFSGGMRTWRRRSPVSVTWLVVVRSAPSVGSAFIVVLAARISLAKGSRGARDGSGEGTPTDSSEIPASGTAVAGTAVAGTAAGGPATRCTAPTCRDRHHGRT